MKRGALTVRIRNLCPQLRGALTATITHMKGNHLAGLGIHRDPDPLLIRLFLDEAAHFIRFHLKPLNHHVTVTGDWLDMKMIRQCLEALDQETSEPLEVDPHRTTDTRQRYSLPQPAFDQRSAVIRDGVLCEAVDKLTATVIALMVLFAMVDVAIVLVLGGLTPWTHVADDHRLLLTSAGVGSVFGQQ
jgi:hypothetical protein